MHRRYARTVIAGPVLVLLSALTACGGDQASSGGMAVVTPAAAPTPVATPVTPVASSNCADTAPGLDLTNALPVADCGQGALVAAIASSSNGRVTLPSRCTITLTTPIQVNKDLTIEGNGATISGGNATRLFEVGRDPSRSRGYRFALQNATLTQGRDSGSGGAAVRGAQFGTMTFINVAFTNNVSNGTGGEDGGGAIFKDEGGRLTIFGSSFTGNVATNGGAIKSLLSNVQIVNTTFANNVARGGNNGGGGVFIDGLEMSPVRQSVSAGGYGPDGSVADSYGKARLCGALFQANVVNGQYDINNTGKQGGGLFTHVYGAGGAGNVPGASLVEVERSIFQDNKARGDGGGARFGGNGQGQARISHSMFVNNRGGHGGAVRLSMTDGDFTNSAMIGNCASADGTAADACTQFDNNGSGLGGGIAAFDNRYTVSRVTVANNHAAGYAGGLQQGNQPQNIGSLANSIVTDNQVGNSYGLTRTCGARFTDGGNSWQWPAPHPGDSNDPGCGTASTANPLVSATATLCGTVAGSVVQGMTAFHRAWLPDAAGPVSRVNGVPVAGAQCPG